MFRAKFLIGVLLLVALSVSHASVVGRFGENAFGQAAWAGPKAEDPDLDGFSNLFDDDDDGDGVKDDDDKFPLDTNEAFDTDNYGLGNNTDLDDDNDGFTDEQEAIDGTDPLSRFSCKSGCFSFDVDESMKAQPLTDGLLVIRHLFGFSGDSLTSGAVSGDATRDASDTIANYLTNADSQLDID